MVLVNTVKIAIIPNGPVDERIVYSRSSCAGIRKSSSDLLHKLKPVLITRTVRSLSSII